MEDLLGNHLPRVLSDLVADPKPSLEQEMNNIFEKPHHYQGNKARTSFSAVYLAAGLSSRFGYRIKCLQEVGRLGETLLELSIRQLAKYGLSEVIIVVSRSTYPRVHLVAGDLFEGIPVTYCFQVSENGCEMVVMDCLRIGNSQLSKETFGYCSCSTLCKECGR